MDQLRKKCFDLKQHIGAINLGPHDAETFEQSSPHRSRTFRCSADANAQVNYVVMDNTGIPETYILHAWIPGNIKKEWAVSSKGFSRDLSRFSHSSRVLPWKTIVFNLIDQSVLDYSGDCRQKN